MEAQKGKTIKLIIGVALIVLSLILSVFSDCKKNISPFLVGLIFLIIGIGICNLTEKNMKDPIYYIFIISLTIPIFIAYLVVSIKGKPIWFDDFHMEELVSLYGNILAYAGTIALGMVAILQNARITALTEISVNGDIKDKKGFLLPKVYRIRDGSEREESYNIRSENNCICFYNAGNDYIHDFKFVKYQIGQMEFHEEPNIHFIGLEGDSKRVYIPLLSLDSKVFESVDITIHFTFSMTNSKGYSYQQELKVMLEDVGENLHKIKGYDIVFPKVKKK